jgi:hypothetical protein
MVGMKEANHFHTFMCFISHKLCRGKFYSNFANATTSPPTCVGPCLLVGYDIQLSYPRIVPPKSLLGLGYAPLFPGGVREKTVYKNGFLDRCVSAIYEFSRNEFELSENKIERERESIIIAVN